IEAHMSLAYRSAGVSSHGSAQLPRMVEMIMQCGQHFLRELLHTDICAALGIAFEEGDGLKVSLVLGINVGLIEDRAALVLQIFHDDNLLAVELLGRRLQLGLGDGLLESDSSCGMVRDHLTGEALHVLGTTLGNREFAAIDFKYVA